MLFPLAAAVVVAMSSPTATVSSVPNSGPWGKSERVYPEMLARRRADDEALDEALLKKNEAERRAVPHRSPGGRAHKQWKKSRHG